MSPPAASVRRLRPPVLLLAGLCTLILACGDSSAPASPTPEPRAASPTPEPRAASPTPEPRAASPTPKPRAASPTPKPRAASPTPSPVVSPPAAVIVPAFPGLPDLERPVALVDVPGHDLFLIVLAEGRVLAVPRDGPYENPRTVHDQRETTVCCGSEEGLLSIALDPDFARNRYVYAYYSPRTEQPSTRIVRFETAGEGESFAFDAASEFLLYETAQPYRNHNGGTLAFGPDGMLYLGIGDGGSANDPHGHGQDRSTPLGSIIRIDVRGASVAAPYATPPDNPFVGHEGALPETWAYGMRNPWRMSFDRETGLLWAGDVGQHDLEEVNVIRSGGNYGWNTAEGTSCFSPPEGCDRAGLTPPVWEYSHAQGCSITGGYVYRGEAIPSLRGWYLFSDYCNGLIWAIPAEAAAAGLAVEPVLLWGNGPNAAVSFAEDIRGELYFISFAGERIYRFVSP